MSFRCEFFSKHFVCHRPLSLHRVDINIVYYSGSVDLYAFTGDQNLILSNNSHICHDEENMSSSSKVYLSYVDRSQIPRNCHGTDVRHLACRCNANDNYCFQSVRVRRRRSLGITTYWPLYRNICRIQDDRFCGIIGCNDIPTREVGQFKVDSCATEEVAYMITFMENNMLGKQNISLLIMQQSAMLISIMI